MFTNEKKRNITHFYFVRLKSKKIVCNCKKTCFWMSYKRKQVTNTVSHFSNRFQNVTVTQWKTWKSEKRKRERCHGFGWNAL